ncbi:site-specific integrase [Bradyrhizobium sp.]|uniref:tyrosine-type recombinase/integrase n=1 Tax=Bradyrhizobium sp. TaxID=376 RepID=UPI0027329765|nr:site-specific integrase [Bradyrhizobium sp.]MDP3691845.1 integrase arm-type DNA-binding domain-containing protein [Bradyrhizobium sp.]
MTRPFTPLSVKAFRPTADRREIPDPGCKGLYLVVQPAGAKSWAFRYRFVGKPKKLTLGPVYLGTDEPEHAALDQANTLAGARKLAGEAALQVARGIDPGKQKKRQKKHARLRAEQSELLDRDTFEAVARLFIEKYAKQKTRPSSWLQTARLIGLKPDPDDESKLVRTESAGEVLSQWGDRTVREITRRDVHDLLDRIVSRGSPVTANRVLAAIRKMFTWAASRDIVAVSPCAGVSPPTAEQSRDRVLDDGELRLIWRGADAIGWPFGPMVQTLILTLQRRDEVADMSRPELKAQDRLWVIPRDRVKNGQEHEVPMSPAAWALLEGLPMIGRRGLIFTVTGTTPVSGFSRAKERLDAEIIKLQKVDAVERGDNPADVQPLAHWTLHDLRRTGATGMARLGINLPVIEKILNHTSGSFRGVAGVYQRHSFADEKRRALEAWSNFVLSLVNPGSATNVVSMVRGASDHPIVASA